MVIKHQNDQIVRYLNQETAEKIILLSPDLPANLPLKTDEDIEIIENYLIENSKLSDVDFYCKYFVYG